MCVYIVLEYQKGNLKKVTKFYAILTLTVMNAFHSTFCSIAMQGIDKRFLPLSFH